ncbi:DUF4906 domain-containing protein [Phocaeicola coprocola]|jgi:hypothetical protein|uniref:DUF4906 domain-containing protein n=1 Tax=Phocaeicola coprocola TaxID=310298 RepID=A0A412GPC3_9BACT|nr:DUF4906 domain-containing protein [Phocaeicola coprocola]RGR96616.1 DUF4906 domain-containing protein [Phocaeicola coprocola]
MKHFVRHIILFLMIATVTSCYDEFMKQEIIGEGKASISATLDFKPMSSALSRTRAAGDALKDISSLHVLLYDKDKNLIEKWKIDGYTVSDENRNDSDAENGNSAETSTKRATFKLPEEIGFGKYYMYAVANIPDLLTNSAYSEAIKTVDGLKGIPLTWDSENVAKNGQMIGFFTKSSAPALSADDESLIVNEKSVKLHAWLRRAASKVTVAFDGSNLKEGVFIYIQSVQIKDIPSQCYLGKDNNVGREGYTLDMPGSGPDMSDGETITYHEGDMAEDFEYGEGCADHRVTVGSPHFGSHDETAPALYFYENMQGAGVTMPDKRQDADNNGILDFPGLPNKPEDPNKEWNYRLKDAVPYGTYIEVHAHYISNNSERLGNGHIIYRFMLGQNETNDYNAKRNCHYKLTLKFKNFANEADWHIEYEEPEPGVMTPEPYYISYLYNHSMMYPIKVNTGGRKIEYIKAEILENNWAPYNASSDIYYTGAPNGVAAPWNGFLSLHKTTETVLYENRIGSNEQYYNKVPKRGEREYKDFVLPGGITSKEFTTENSEPDDKYRVEKHPTEANTYNIYIPMYTRAKQMISTTGYTGNNPYVAYQRKARVKITTKLEGLDKIFENEVPIYQVRRVVNPKGIYRSLKNNKSFHVVLKRLPGEDQQMFKTFQSEGPWKAYVVKETNGKGITLSVTDPNTTELKDDPEYGKAIYGKTGSVIDFNVNFEQSSDNPSENRYAIIRVEYHNYTCQHLIFVRQGDKPDDLVTNGVKWYAMNMKTTSELASNPLDEGSLFKFGNWSHPIDALSNKNPREPWINITPGDFKIYPEDGFTNAATGDKMVWTDIIHSNTTDGFGNPQMANARVATGADFWELRKYSYIEQGYGVLYGDDATETADDIVEVYGYNYEHNKSGRGMRGCFAYNSETGKNLFFPIGASGYGHRKQSYPATWGDPETINGVLRYAAGRTKLYPSPVERPLFYDLYKRPGGIYWLNAEIPQNYFTPTDGVSLGWDINYFSFDFNFISKGNLIRSDGSDACFVRCVVDP